MQLGHIQLEESGDIQVDPSGRQQAGPWAQRSESCGLAGVAVGGVGARGAPPQPLRVQ